MSDNIALSSAVVGTHFLGFVDMSNPDCVQGGTLSLVMDECANIMTNNVWYWRCVPLPLVVPCTQYLILT
jgi:hypothetical protein